MEKTPQRWKALWVLKWNCFPRAPVPGPSWKQWGLSRSWAEEIRVYLFFLPLKTFKLEKFSHELDVEVQAWSCPSHPPGPSSFCPQPSSESCSSLPGSMNTWLIGFRQGPTLETGERASSLLVIACQEGSLHTEQDALDPCCSGLLVSKLIALGCTVTFVNATAPLWTGDLGLFCNPFFSPMKIVLMSRWKKSQIPSRSANC